jgi:hypothetical protein
MMKKEQNCYIEHLNCILSVKTRQTLLSGLKSFEDTQPRSSRTFPGFYKLAETIMQTNNISKSGFLNVLTRHTGRVDFQLTNAFVQWTGIAHDLKKSGVVTKLIKAIKDKHDCIPLLRTINVMIVFPSATDQPIHTDIPGTKRGELFTTMIIPLNKTTKLMGGTEILSSPSIVLRGKPGYGFSFSGEVKHRGLGNKSKKPRIFLYFAVSYYKDANSESAVYTIV